jgi:uncharacterized protein
MKSLDRTTLEAKRKLVEESRMNCAAQLRQLQTAYDAHMGALEFIDDLMKDFGVEEVQNENPTK